MARAAMTKKSSGNNRGVFSQQKDEQAEIERLAYQFFVERGYEHGHDQEDWFRAAELVKKQRS